MKKLLMRRIVPAAALLMGLGGVAEAQNTVPMTGALNLRSASVAALVRQKFVEDGTVMTDGTGAVRTIKMPRDQWFLSAFNKRVFPAFPGVAQNTEIASTTHPTVTFKAGGGAGDIAFCPKVTPCSGFTQATVPGGQGFVGVLAGPNVFGGAFRLLRHIKPGSGAWFVKNPGPTPTKTVGFNPNVRGVVITPSGASSNTSNSVWSAGFTNFATVIDDNPPSRIYTGFLGPDGAVQTLGNFQGTATFDPPEGIATGFQMTTGTVVVSDATPPTTMGGAFSFSTNGYDNRDASGNGNIQLVGGGVSYGGVTGNVFFRITRLRMAVPEAAGMLTLGAGLIGLAGLSRVRRARRAGAPRL